MKRVLLLLAGLLIIGGNAYSQISVSGGMGVNYTGTSSLIDYLDKYYSIPGDRPANGYTTIEFFFEADYNAKEHLTLGLDYAYRFYSYSAYVNYFNYEMSYNVHAPSLMCYYTIKGKGYQFNFGGGAGVRFASLEETKFPLGKANYSLTGGGLLLKAAGNTALSEHFYALISGTIKYDIYGKTRSETAPEDIDLTSISAGVNLGLSYYF